MANKNIFDDFSDFMAFFDKTKIQEDINIKNKINTPKIEDTQIDKEQNTKNNKLKCNFCKARINLLDTLISTCKCNYNYCKKHRMPELHKCEFLQDKCLDEKKNLENNLIKLCPSKLNTI
jgi:hypothetical protein